MQRDASIWINTTQNFFKNYCGAAGSQDSPWDKVLLCAGVWYLGLPNNPGLLPSYFSFWNHSRTGNDIQIGRNGKPFHV